MANYLSTLTDELTTLIETACPELANVWPAEVLMRVPIDTLAVESEIPFAVVHYSGFQAGEWGISNFAYEAEVEILYVQKVPEAMDDLRRRLEALRDAFQDEITTPTLTVGQVLEVTGLTWSAFSAPNTRFISKLLPYVSGSVMLRVVTGEM